MAEGDLKAEECCLENKQSAAASSSSVSEEEGSASVSLKSSGVSSPVATSPSHRYRKLNSLHFCVSLT
uniref:Uncharacterized protein n=1 Tax=Chenopodium quinoa TaxID=63459 RepID=A0A803N5Z2_CHEQI